MKNVLITLSHLTVGLFILIAIWPALNVSDEGYTTKKEGVIVSQAEDPPVITTAVEEAKSENVSASPEIKEVSVAEESPLVENDIKNEKENETGALYSVVDGNKLDANSYAGFKLYRNWCARCHGTYGQGMAGPDLVESLKIISEKEFFQTVENGKVGSIGSMPAWKTNPKVMAGRDQLYAYLKARSDGAIGEVKPKKQ